MEAVFVKLASEKNLKEDEVETLGKFRQAYQQLREAIRDNRVLDWSYFTHPEYLSFKVGATKVACMINLGSQKLTALERKIFGNELDDLPSKEVAANNLCKITSNVWEGNWREITF